MSDLEGLFDRNLKRLTPDPIRAEIAALKDLGFDPAEHPRRNFTIGVPAPLPEDMRQIAAEAAHGHKLQGNFGYPPFLGQKELIDLIVQSEIENETGLTWEDRERIGLTLGASGGIEYSLSLFESGMRILVPSPEWGTVYNMIADSGHVGLPVQMFTEDGEFNQSGLEKYMDHDRVAVYLNILNNPNPVLPSEKGFKDLLEFIEKNELIVFSDDPYMYTMFDRGNIAKYSILNAPEAVRDRTIAVRSFSKVTAPEDRFGYVVVGREIADKLRNAWKMRLRDYGAGLPGVVQASILEILKHDPKLDFLSGNIAGYQANVEAVVPHLQALGFRVQHEMTDGAYFVFVEAPDGKTGREAAYGLAKRAGVGVIPGSSFLPDEKHYLGTEFEGRYGEITDPHRGVLNQVRVGIGGAADSGSIEEAMTHALTKMK